MEADTTGLGLGVTYTEFDIGTEIAAPFGPWHSGEHIGERLAIPGMRSARRYVAMANPLRFAAVYRGADSDLFRSPAYRALFDHLSGETRRIMASLKGTRFIGDVVRENGNGYGALMCRLRVTSAPAADGELSAWYDEAAEGLLARHGVVRLTLMTPRRDNENVSDANCILLVEGYDLATLKAVGEGGHRIPHALGETTAELFQLEHIVI